jgi:hypothetical protein
MARRCRGCVDGRHAVSGLRRGVCAGRRRSIKALSGDGVALHYLLEAYKHLKRLPLHGEAKQLLDVLHLQADDGLLVLKDAKDLKAFFAAIAPASCLGAGAEGQGNSGLRGRRLAEPKRY